MLSKVAGSRKESNKIFKSIDLNKDNTATHDEIYKFVAKNDTLWNMLGENLNLSQLECKGIATRVAMELASGLQGDAAMRAELTKDQFHQFRKKYMLDEKGSTEFFHRAVFATFDKNRNNELEEDELEDFLNIFYMSNSIFAGESQSKLPAKHVLKRQIMEKFDDDGNGSLDFDEIRLVIAGEGNLDALPEPSEFEDDEPKARSSMGLSAITNMRANMTFSFTGSQTSSSSNNKSSSASASSSSKGGPPLTAVPGAKGGRSGLSRSSSSTSFGGGESYRKSFAASGRANSSRSTTTTTTTRASISLKNMDPKKASAQIFKELDSNNKKAIGKDQIARFVSNNKELWTQLNTKLGKPKAECQKVSTRVVMELASDTEGPEAFKATIDKDQFHEFRKKYMLEAWGSNEFFYRTIFATFDVDHDNGLNDDELDNFLDIFYEEGSAFKGENMPTKPELKQMVIQKYDDDGNGLLEFEEIRLVIKDAAMFAKKPPSKLQTKREKEQAEKERKRKLEEKKAADAALEEKRKRLEAERIQKEIDDRRQAKLDRERQFLEEDEQREQEQLAAMIEENRRRAEARLAAEAAARRRNPKTILIRMVVRMFVPPQKQNTTFNYAETQLVSYKGNGASCIIL